MVLTHSIQKNEAENIPKNPNHCLGKSFLFFQDCLPLLLVPAISQQNIYLSSWFDSQTNAHVPLLYLLYDLIKCKKYLLRIIPMDKNGINIKDLY